MTIIHECEQGTEEWKRARCGVITASMFSTIRAKVGMPNEQQQIYINCLLAGQTEKAAMEKAGYKSAPKADCIKKAVAGEKVGEWSDAAKNYAFRLACERIAGEPLDGDQFETFAMRRGRALEEQCRLRHEAEIKTIVDLAGFVTTEDNKFGCSADSLIGEHGGAEYKAFYAPEKVRPVLAEDDWGDILDQVQGCMWITGRKWWEMCLYFPALASVGKDFTRKRILRDDNYIESLEADLMEFETLVSEWQELLMQKPQQQAAA
ncbi:MAG: YqaJ viral recombinase family protein [Pseudomonadota bacterium]